MLRHMPAMKKHISYYMLLLHAVVITLLLYIFIIDIMPYILLLFGYIAIIIIAIRLHIATYYMLRYCFRLLKAINTTCPSLPLAAYTPINTPSLRLATLHHQHHHIINIITCHMLYTCCYWLLHVATALHHWVLPYCCCCCYMPCCCCWLH